MFFNKKIDNENSKLLLNSYIKIDNIICPIEEVQEFIQRNKVDYLKRQIEIRIDSYFNNKLIPKEEYENKQFLYSLGVPRKAEKNSYYILLSIFEKE